MFGSLSGFVVRPARDPADTAKADTAKYVSVRYFSARGHISWPSAASLWVAPPTMECKT